MSEIIAPKRLDIQILRGISVTGVFLFHLFPNSFSSGYLGVDVFFVISGFLLTPNMLQIVNANQNSRTKKAFDFYRRRFVRLTPALVLTVVSFSLWLFLFGPLGEHRYGFIQGLTALFNLANIEAFRLSQGDYFQPEPNGLLHTWSLSVEEQLFVLIPLLLLLLRIFFKKTDKILIVILFLISAFCFGIINYTQILDDFPYFIGDQGFFYFSPIFRGFEFLCGSMAWAFSKKLNGVFPSSLTQYSYFAVIILMCIPTKINFSLILILIFTMLQLGNEPSKPAVFFEKLFSHLGDYSYSIYLVHLPVIYIVNHWWTENYLNSDVFKPIITVLLIFSVSFTSYRLVEVKLRNRLNKGDNTYIFKASIIFLILPITLLAVLRFGSTNYYGIASPPELVGSISCESDRDLGFCGKISDTKTNFILIGDSHAAALSETFSAEIRKQGGNPIVMFGRGCPIINSISNSRVGAASPCEQYRIRVEEILNNKKMVLVISQRSSEGQISGNLYMQNLISGIKKLSLLAMKTYVISPNPEYARGMSQGTVSELRAKNAKSAQNSMPIASFDNLQELKLALSNSGVGIFNSINLFCSSGFCDLKRDNNYLYWDSNHLSREGAKLYSKFFSEIATNPLMIEKRRSLN